MIFLWSRVRLSDLTLLGSHRGDLMLPGSFPPIAICSWSRVSLACCRGSHSNNKAATAPSIAFYCPSIAHCANFDSIVGQEYCLPNPSSFKMEENGPVCVVFSCREMRSIIQLLEYSKTSPSPSSPSRSGDPPSISGTESRIIKPLVSKRPGEKI